MSNKYDDKEPTEAERNIMLNIALRGNAVHQLVGKWRKKGIDMSKEVLSDATVPDFDEQRENKLLIIQSRGWMMNLAADIRTVVHEADELEKKLKKRRGLAEPTAVMGGEILLGEVLRNLLENAEEILELANGNKDNELKLDFVKKRRNIND